MALEGERQGGQRRLTSPLGQRLFSQRTADAAIAIFKRMNVLEIQMCQAGADQGRERHFALRCRGVEPGAELPHFLRHGSGRRCLEMDPRAMHGPGDDLHGLEVGAVGANAT